MQRILSSEGFYDGRVDTRIERTPVAGDTVTDAAGAEGRRRGRRGPVIAVVDVAPGPRYSFASIDIQADPPLPPALTAAAFPIPVGKPLDAPAVQGAEAAPSPHHPRARTPRATT